MTVPSVEGPLAGHLSAAVAQLSASTPYEADVVVQDVVWAPGRERSFQDYRGDLSGRYLDAVAVGFAQGLPVDADKAATILRSILDSQGADGMFGPPSPAIQVDHGSAWGHGRLLEGLLSARSWAPSSLAGALEDACARLVDAMVVRSGRWAEWVADSAGQKFHFDPLSAVLPLARYAELTSFKPALAAARTLISSLPEDVSGAHMHGYLLALRGQLEIGRLTGGESLVDGVVARVSDVAASYVLPHGGVLESVSIPWDVNTEGCGIADWIMLNLRLYSLLGSPAYLDRAAVSSFNALLHAQRPSGHFGCETLASTAGFLVTDYAPEAWWCCTFHGIRAIQTLASAAVGLDDDAVRIHLPVDVSVGDQLTIDGGYPYDDTITVTAGPSYPAHRSLHIRVPSTATLASVSIDGSRTPAVASDGWLRLGDVRPGTQVGVRLDQHDWFLAGSRPVLPPFANTTVSLPDLSEQRCAVFHGPLLLAANAADNDLEDVLRAQYVVHLPSEPTLGRDDAGAFTSGAKGHDGFRTTLRLAPLAGRDRARNDRATKAWFAGLQFNDRGLHA